MKRGSNFEDISGGIWSSWLYLHYHDTITEIELKMKKN
jgi:hypothetical protein